MGLREELFLYLFQMEGNEQLTQSYKLIDVSSEAVLKETLPEEDRIVTVIPNITRGWNEYNIRKNIDKIMAALRPKGIMEGNIGWIESFTWEGVNVFGDKRLNLYHSVDFLLAFEIGSREAVISHEADLEDIHSLDSMG